jgi:hypothetical protein
MLLTLLGAELITPSRVAIVSRGVTAVVGLLVALLAYRGYRRNDARKMRALAVGIALLTAGVFVAATTAEYAGGGAGTVLLARGTVTVTGLCALLYALVHA